jgi:hypothetical protein
MGRDVQPDDGAREVESPMRPTAGRAAATDGRPSSRHEMALGRALREWPVWWRDRPVMVRDSARVALKTVGTFRTVAIPDLARFTYHGDWARLDADVRQLVRRGWLERHTLPGRRGGREVPVLVLSRDGHAFATRHLATDGQALHYGLVKPKEQAHDAALFRVYHAETARITEAGGTVRRVILDAELKGQVAAARNRPADAADAAERAAQVARELGLTIAGGSIQIPDMRVEYETREGSQTRVDLELATEHYKPSQVALKAQAGFTIYAPASQTERLSSALEERGLLTEILSL